MTNIKKMREKAVGCTYIYKDGNEKAPFNTKINVRDQITTCLVCESIDIDFNNDFYGLLQDVYKDIDKSLYHNLILSIKDGCIMYRDFNGVLMYYPYFDYIMPSFENVIVCPETNGYQFEHILLFVNYFYMCIYSVSILYIDITVYLGSTRTKTIISGG